MRKHLKLMFVALLALFVTGLVAPPAGATLTRSAVAADTRPTTVHAQSLTALYRLWSPGASDHFYTTNWPEAVNAFNNLGYRYEGVQARVSSTQAAGTTPLYRLWSPGASDHFYTTNWPEATNAF